MKKYLHIMLVTLVLFALTACQATPTEIPSVDFFKDDAERWITVKPPAGWVAKQSDEKSASVIVTNDWAAYQKPETKAIGIIILPLADKGSAVKVLQTALGRFKTLLNQPIGDVALVQADGQDYASIEYQGISIQQNSELAYYLFTVISKNDRNVLVFVTVSADDVIGIKPTYLSTVKGITLH